MKVFLSWSGKRSQLVAEALKTWLGDTIQHVDPWISSVDIAKGARWSVDLFSELEGTNIGIICLTPENITAPWILFESGALGKTLDKSRVCTYLYELRPADLEGPLVQFQATMANEPDTLKLLHSLNDALPDDQKRTKEQVERAFERWWPDFKKALDEIPTLGSNAQNIRQDRELLEEILDIIRMQAGRSQLTERELAKSEEFSFYALFDGDDVRKFAATVKLDGRLEDDNAADWAGGAIEAEARSIEGEWLSRWSGTRRSWSTGTARVLQTGDYVLFWYDEDDSVDHPYLIVARREGKNRLVGRYVNLIVLDDSTPWVGLVVDNRRIDGRWKNGRWDFRR